MSTTTTFPDTAAAPDARPVTHYERTAPMVLPPARRIPLSRIVAVELRKSFDTRAGFWLLASIGAAALLTTGAVIAWAPRAELTYSQFVLAIGMPMTVILPIIAALSVTSEWTQRTGLATFTLVPHRGRVLLGKAAGSLLVALVSTVVAFAVVAYMVYAFVLPGVLTLLALYQAWFDDLRPWVDAKLTQSALMQGGLTGDQWQHLVVTSVVWLVVPLVVGVVRVLRAEVK
jgi:ABC-2 type transport system permease protein